MEKNKDFVSEVTEFPIEASEEQTTRFGFSGLSKLFSFGRYSGSDSLKNEAGNVEKVAGQSISNLPSVESFINSEEEGRSLPNVLKRISSLVALKEGTTSEKNLKMYWMPDSFSNECYDCGEKFTAFRRRHHCRVCGQIFCSRCCYQRIPGKIMQCSGDLRVCTYCCKVVLSYLESANMNTDLSSDLRAVQEHLQIKLGSQKEQQKSPAVSDTINAVTSHTRKLSLGYQEERFVLGRAPNCTVLSDEERCQALQESTSLRGLFEEILDPVIGIELQPFHYIDSDIPDCLLGSILVDWLIANSKAANRDQALAMVQILLEAGYLESVTDTRVSDGDSHYRVMTSLNTPPLLPRQSRWGATTGSESKKTHEDEAEGLRQSVSSYKLNMDVVEGSVHVARPDPPESTGFTLDASKEQPRKKVSVAHEADLEASVFLNAPPHSDSIENVEKPGWHRVDHLVKSEHEEADAYFRLCSSFASHQNGLLRQLLRSCNLAQSWETVITPIAQTVVDQVRVDHRNSGEMDIRSYVQIKQLPGGTKSGIKVVPGVVCSKNVVHRAMRTRIDNARILILRCAIVYQRVEGRMLSLEPVMMQEHEYLRHVVSRIHSMQPDVVLVHKNVSRLAQEHLLKLNISLVLNVKMSVLNRVSRLTGAEVVKSVDAYVGKPQLGTCSSFFLETFHLDNETKKTLMFFEGNPGVSCTVLLRGGSPTELRKLKKITSFLILSEYNWRLEKSFLMDEFARPPSPPRQLFQDSPSCSLAERLSSPPDKDVSDDHHRRMPLPSLSSIDSIHLDPLPSDLQMESTAGQTFSEAKPEAIKSETMIKDQPQINAKLSIPCETDPLQSHSFDSLDIKWETPAEIETVQLAVADLPQKNKFRTALDDTIISISPFLKLAVPYLESDSGKNCSLRSYFPDDLFNSKQFHSHKQEKEIKNSMRRESLQSCNLLPKHDFLTTMITEDASSAAVQTLLALYRANGGQIPLGTKGRAARRKSLPAATAPMDVLDPFEHQLFSVLFCSYSVRSENAPAFCVDPWVVTMTSYGPNDIPLGWFLEYYCFRPTASCPSKTCHLPLNQHTRRFVHDAGELRLSLNTLPNNLETGQIWMWNWCSQCELSSQRVSMTSDTWSLSFAKYLELRFLGECYTRRGPEGCHHSLHHSHVQYFAQDNLVAKFQFLAIPVKWELSLPPRIISRAPIPDGHAQAVDELRGVAIKGHEVFSAIVSFFMGLETLSENDLQTMKQQQMKDQTFFKMKIEEIQMRLTSPTIEKKRFEPGEALKEAEVLLWRVQDSITALKRFICETVASWNNRFLECKRKEDRSKRASDGNVKGQVSPPQSEDGCSKDESDLNSTGDTEEEHVWEKLDENVDVMDSEDNQSVASHQEDARSADESKEKRILEESYAASDLKIDKKSVKTILTQMLTPSKDTTAIQCPWNPLEHYQLPPSMLATVVVIESELSSVIAYALASQDHKRYLEDKNISALSVPSSDTSTASPGYRRKTLSSSSSADKDHQSDSTSSLNHCDVFFSDSTATFSCRIFFAEDFANFRNLAFPSGEEAFIRSLSNCVTWAARGGKSGSAFSKTKDDRFVIKQMQKTELSLFENWAQQYLSYVTRCLEEKQPTLLGKILGVFSISCRTVTGNAHRSHLLVMENLFYQRVVTHKYDLKGSVRNRLVNPAGSRDSEIVYMDENLLKMTCDSPLYMMQHSHSLLLRAIEADTEFLAGQHVMDYSLLVGLENSSSEIVVGIIDYIRTFTWDKRLENMMKTSVMMGHPGKQPTIIEPKDYRERFIAAMKRYFLPVPDRWFGFSNSPFT